MAGLFLIAMALGRYHPSRLISIVLPVSLGLPAALIVRNLIDVVRHLLTNYYIFTIVTSLVIALPAAFFGAKIGTIIGWRNDQRE